jgi:dinuclear metal center YbgI/SA1388 family protein
MGTVRDVLRVLEEIAPARHALGFDKVGLQVGDPDGKIERAVVSLDRSLGAVAFAAERKAGLLVAHHPLIFQPLPKILTTGHDGRTVTELIRNGIHFVAAHTNWDAAPGGINDALAERLGLRDVEPFGEAAAVANLRLIFFCPPESADRVLDAVSEAGAGVIGAYKRCAFKIPGTGTFFGTDEANPTVGEAGQIEEVHELRVETILPLERERAVTQALRKAHPYEEPAYDLVPLHPAYEQPLGRLGRLAKPLTLKDLVDYVDDRLGTRSTAWGREDRRIERVAVVGGSADGEWRNARSAGADALVTGEVKQHVALEAAESGFSLLAAGHYATEQPGCEALREALAQRLPEIEWDLFMPAPGMSGRPL